MVAGVIFVFSMGAHCAPAMVRIVCSNEGGNPIYSTSEGIGVKAFEGWVVQIITIEGSSTRTPPDANGNPNPGLFPPNRLALIPTETAGFSSVYRKIGITPEALGQGEYASQSFIGGGINLVTGTGNSLFIRVWNAPSIGAATKYGDSIPVTPTTSGNVSYSPASFYVWTDKPGESGPSWVVGTGETTTSIKWTWNSVPGATAYQLFNKDTGNLVTTVDATSTVESGMAGPNRVATREVKGIIEGVPTSMSTGSATAYTLADVPTIGSATGGWKSGQGNYVAVTWTAPTNPAGTTYRLKRSDGTPVFGPTTLTTTTDVNILPPSYKLCTYEVVALNGNGKATAPSDQVFTRTPPGRPATFTTSGVTTDAITWNWTQPASGGQDRYNFYLNGLWYSTTEGSRITPFLDICRKYSGTVEAVSDMYGTGEPFALNRWTLPVTPPQPVDIGPSGTPSSVDLRWSLGNANVNANYSVSYSVLTNEGYSWPESSPSPATEQSGTFMGAKGSWHYYWRVRAANGDGVYSGYSLPQGVWTSGGTTGLAPTISRVYIGDRAYRNGMVTGSKPRITATISYDAVAGIDTDYTYGAVTIDEDDLAKAIIFASSEVTYEAPGPGAPTYTYTLSAVSNSPLPGLPAGGTHTLKIRVRDASKLNSSTWTGYVGVMSGGVQMIGAAYNYPNPFRPLSTDPNQNTTRIAYNLSVDAAVTLIIYDITGHEVYRKAFHSGASGGQAGLNSVPFNGQSMFGEALGNGMYLYKLISGSTVIGSGKLVVLD